MKIFLLGTGNIAWTLGELLHERQHLLYGIYGRDSFQTKSLAERWNSQAYNQWSEIPSDADIYLFTLQDQAYEQILPLFPHRNKVMLHTSGSLPLSLFEKNTSHSGVLYPFQSCTKGKLPANRRIPLCLEATDKATASLVDEVASFISDECYWIESKQRQMLHLAGVFANNFSNALYGIAFDLLAEAKLDSGLLQGLIQETALKVEQISPFQAQTGPAKRNDANILHKHLALLEKHPEWKELYKMMTSLIQKQQTKINSSLQFEHRD